jgi:shikimate kinase
VCNAVIKAVLDSHSFDMDIMDIIRLGVECAKEAKVTVTGSFDDACGCELGGLIFTENYSTTLIRRKRAEDYDVILCIPEYTKERVPRERYEAVTGRM